MIKKSIDMTKRTLIIPVLVICSLLPLKAQINKKDSGLKREVTLYNPYKPSLQEATKQNFLPDIKDTSTIRPVFHYEIEPKPFYPEYNISPIKAAVLQPDPLTKLYKSYINMGMGNYLTPLAEISITNERSKKGTYGLYARHFSTNANIELDNGGKGFAGYMDNDVSLFGKKFFSKNILEGSLDYAGKDRYAYGCTPFYQDFSPAKKDIKIPLSNIGVKASLYSMTADSSELAYNFASSFNFISEGKDFWERKFSLAGTMSKKVLEFYAGNTVSIDYYKLSDSISTSPQYVASLAPFIKKRSEQWGFKLGFRALLDKHLSESAKIHLYPDIDVNFFLVPKYINFFAGLSGQLDKNEPSKLFLENPYLLRDGTLFKQPNTSHDLIILAGLKGNSGLGGNYLISASYSMFSDMLFYSNIEVHDTIRIPKRGNYFSVLTDNGELLKLHGEMNGPITNKLSFTSSVNLYRYNMSNYQYAWGKPGWDGELGLKYNLRDKIVAGMDLCLQGTRKMIINGESLSVIPAPLLNPARIVDMPVHFNLNLSAEYCYSKILSFWTKLNNIAARRYYEWAYYPSQRFFFMFGLTYSL